MKRLIAALALAACGDGGGGGAAPDAGSLEPPAGCDLEAPPAGWTYPAGPYGSQVGERFADFELDDCDLQPVEFGDLLAGSELVLFSVGAGWCEPCIEESEVLNAEIFEPFCARGLRVVQVLFQDDQSFPATSLFCREWKARFGLRFPVLIDPLFVTSQHFERSQTPLNLLIDPSGTIVFRETGTPANDLPARIDQLLPE